MFVLKKAEQIAGTISVIPDTPAFGLPMEGTFNNEIHSMRRLGVRMGEVGLLALNGDLFSRKKFSMADFSKYKALFSLFRAMLHYSYYSDVHVTDLVIAIHPKHIELYNYILFKQVGRERIYSDGKSAIPMRMNIPEFLEYIKKGPMGTYLGQLVNMHAERSENPYTEERYKWNAAAVKTFLIHRKRLWDQLPEAGRHFLAKQYPGLTN